MKNESKKTKDKMRKKKFSSLKPREIANGYVIKLY